MKRRDWIGIRYLPILALTPAEMRALEELPSRDKDLLLPLIHLRPWVGSHKLESSIARIEKAYGSRPYIVDIASPEPGDDEQDRPVFQELRALRDSADGYRAWFEFVEEREHLIPGVQLRDVSQLSSQVAQLYGLGRGLSVHLRRQTLGVLEPVVAAIAAGTNGGSDVCFVVDLGRQTRDLLLAEAETVSIVRRVKAVAPNSAVSISASSFPESFTAISHQDIFERQHFDGVAAVLGEQGLIYSDRGSARAEKQMGGGGTPAPRIDYAAGSRWSFFRSDAVTKDERPAAYVAQARAAMKAPCWDPKLRVWGSQMIEKTGSGDLTAINSPVSCTAARINMHLHRQLFHGDVEGLYDTDEDWSD